MPKLTKSIINVRRLKTPERIKLSPRASQITTPTIRWLSSVTIAAVNKKPKAPVSAKTSCALLTAPHAVEAIPATITKPATLKDWMYQG